MKKLWKSVTALALCAVVLLAAMPTAQGATIYFMAVNDTPLELSDATMPTTVGGVLYVPYTMLSINATGVNLGVYATYSSVKNRVLVYSSRQQLLFDLQEDMTYDSNGHSYAERAIVRNSTVYLPIARVCAVFRNEIEYSLNTTEYGYLVRIKSSSAVLDDEAFITAAANMMSDSLKQYEQEHPASDPNVSPSPSHGAGSGAGAYLAFTLTEDGAVDEVLSALAEQNIQGLFFVTVEELAQRDDLIRQLVGTGHPIGLRVSARTVQDAREELEQGRELLSLVAHCRSDLVLAEALDEKAAAQLRQAGYVVWNTTADGRELEGSGYSRADALMRQMTGGRTDRNYVLLDDRAGSVLSTVLWSIERADYQFRTPVATEL